MPNFCTTCGSPLKPSQKFCTTCGTEIRYSTVVEPEYQRQNCPSCGAAINPKAKFCIKCGGKIAVSTSDLHRSRKQDICPSCGVFVNPDAKFCIKCGTEFGKEITIEPVTIPVEKEPYSVSVSDEPVLEIMVTENCCNACGIPLNPNSNFCTKCGAKAVPASNLKQNTDKGEKWTQAAKKVAEVLEQTIDATDFAGEMRIPVNGSQQSVLDGIAKVVKKL